MYKCVGWVWCEFWKEHPHARYLLPNFLHYHAMLLYILFLPTVLTHQFNAMFTESCSFLPLPTKHVYVNTNTSRHNPNQLCHSHLLLKLSLSLSNLISQASSSISHLINLQSLLNKPWSFWYSHSRHYHSFLIY
jgi:hypothetical protein